MKKILTAALTALLLACTPDTPINEDKLCGTWKADVWIGNYGMHITFNADNTYKMMIGSYGQNINYVWRHPHFYYEGAWMTDDDEILLMSADTIAYTLYDVDVKKNKLSFDFVQGEATMEITKYEAVRGKNLQQSTILGTWSFTERNVLGFTYDMIVTFYEDYHARMTYGTPNTNHGHDVVDIKDMRYSIVGPYIVFDNITPLHYFKFKCIRDEKVYFISGNNFKEMTEFNLVPQDPTAHELRLDGVIF